MTEQEDLEKKMRQVRADFVISCSRCRREALGDTNPETWERLKEVLGYEEPA